MIIDALHEKWAHSNKVCLMVMMHIKDKTITKSITNSPNAKASMESIAEKFVKFYKNKIMHYLSLLGKKLFEMMVLVELVSTS